MEFVDINNIKRRMLVKYPFFGSTVANTNYKEANGLGTAGTDGKTVYYDPYFLEGLTDDEQTFVFAHEICHIAFDHILRSEGKNAKLWNIATDAVINQFLKKDGLSMISGGVDIEDAINYDSEEYYNKLLKELEEQKQQQDQNQQSEKGQNQEGKSNTQKQNSNNGSSDNRQSNEQKSDNGNEDNQDSEVNDNSQEDNMTSEETKEAGHDTHNMWEEAVKKHRESNSNEGDKQESKEQENLKKISEQEEFKKNSEERKKQLEELQKSLSRETRGAGITTNRENRNIDNIGISKPLIEWRMLLRESLKSDVDWSYANAEVEDGVVTPKLEVFPKPETEIVLDTSGSIDKILLKNFLRECKNILQSSKVSVGCFDTEFYGFNEIKRIEDIDLLEYRGGGGTDFEVATSAFSRRVENKIIFTDADDRQTYGDSIGKKINNLPYNNIIWVVFGKNGKSIKPKGGRVIQITEEQLQKLHLKTTETEVNRRTR